MGRVSGTLREGERIVIRGARAAESGQTVRLSTATPPAVPIIRFGQPR